MLLLYLELLLVLLLHLPVLQHLFTFLANLVLPSLLHMLSPHLVNGRQLLSPLLHIKNH